MKKYIALLVLTGLAAVESTQAQTTNYYNFSATGTGFHFTGNLDAVANGDGTYTVVWGRGSFGSTGYFANDTFSLTPNPNAPAPITLAPDWSIDNQLFANGGNISTNGIDFSFTDTSSGTAYFLSTWLVTPNGQHYDSAVVQQDGTYLTSSSNFLNGNGQATIFTLTETAPEPGTIALAGLGISGLIAARRRK